MKALRWMAILLLIILAVVGYCVWYFLPKPITLMAFAEAFNYVASPIVAAFAFFALLFTIKAQNDEISVQREGLANADAQLKVTRLTSRLAAATALLGHYQALLEKSNSGKDESELRQKRDDSLEKVERLEEELRGIINAGRVVMVGEGHFSASGTVVKGEVKEHLE